uniref:Uncharacterized protein n=1 Tax=Poecilia formosa TaxID=48698 RepID=A0A096M115_POEFO
GLWPLAAGLVRRYREAEVAPPSRMHVDLAARRLRARQVAATFSQWTELKVGLDVWLFMPRFAAGVVEAQPLYGAFMARLSRCLFQLDPEDVAALQLPSKRGGPVSRKALDQLVSRREPALHCRKRRGGDSQVETARRIQALNYQMDGESGKDTLGEPLLDHELIQQVWLDQQPHMACIQDPEGRPLYETGPLRKGGVELCC